LSQPFNQLPTVPLSRAIKDLRRDLARRLDREDQTAKHCARAIATAVVAAVAEPGFGHHEVGVAMAALEHVVDRPPIVLPE
jgi:hypothetical protein